MKRHTSRPKQAAWASLVGVFAALACLVGAAYGFAPAEADGALKLCIDWYEGFTGHLDGIAVATAVAALPDSVKELADQVQREWNQIKDKTQELLKKYPDADKLAEYDELFGKFDERFNAMEAKANRLQIEARESRRDGQMPAEAKTHSEAFTKYIKEAGTTTRPERFVPPERKGVIVLPRYEVKDGRNVLVFDYKVVEMGTPEYKALSVDSDPAGGFLVSPTMSQAIIQRVFDTSPVRQYASVITIAGDAWVEPVDDDEASVGWVGETETRSETGTPDLDELRIPLHIIYAKPKATQKMLDMVPDIEGWLTGKVSDKFMREQNTRFVVGNGDKKPRGLTQYVASTAAWNQIKYVASGKASQITYDGIIDTRGDLQSQYMPNANWYMNRATRAGVRKIVDANGNPLWSPGLQAGNPDTLDGRPVVIFEDLPDIATNAYPILFGDLRQGYYVVDHTQGVRILRDPYSSKPYIEFYTTAYAGGGIRQGRALRFMKCATS